MARNERLIYDIGLHKGEDTEFYLKKGYNVVAIEANPHLAERARQRFEREIRSGRLNIIEGAIAPESGSEKVTFFVNTKLSIWGTIDGAWAARNAARDADSVEIEVARLDLHEVFTNFGVPFYLKIDIEGADGLVLSALQRREERPQFVSIEANMVDKAKLMQDLENLLALGYTKFQLAPQNNIGGRRVRLSTLDGHVFEHVFVEGSSGPFGSDLTGLWVDFDAAHGYILDAGWADIHAALSISSTMNTLTSNDLSANGLMNVALNRPATQSSISPWSTSQDPEIDARIANNGDTKSAKFFHTAIETNPWWRVDLQELYSVEKIVIYNRFNQTARLNMFSIYGSEDGNEWIPIYVKNDPNPVTIFVANINEKTRPVRFVKIMLDGHNCLHFRECQIFGRRANLGEYSERSLDNEGL